jgi:hypothetical protein
LDQLYHPELSELNVDEFEQHFKDRFVEGLNKISPEVHTKFAPLAPMAPEHQVLALMNLRQLKSRLENCLIRMRNGNFWSHDDDRHESISAAFPELSDIKELRMNQKQGFATISKSTIALHYTALLRKVQERMKELAASLPNAKVASSLMESFAMRETQRKANTVARNFSKTIPPTTNAPSNPSKPLSSGDKLIPSINNERIIHRKDHAEQTAARSTGSVQHKQHQQCFPSSTRPNQLKRQRAPQLPPGLVAHNNSTSEGRITIVHTNGHTNHTMAQNDSMHRSGHDHLHSFPSYKHLYPVNRQRASRCPTWLVPCNNTTFVHRPTTFGATSLLDSAPIHTAANQSTKRGWEFSHTRQGGLLGPAPKRPNIGQDNRVRNDHQFRSGRCGGTTSYGGHERPRY